MTQIATTPEQSVRLAACGVDTKSADMLYQIPITVSQKQQGKYILFLKEDSMELYKTDIPAWSLSALLSLLPKQIELEGETYELIIKFSSVWGCQIKYKLTYESDILYAFYSKNLFDSIIHTVERLQANGYDFANIKTDNK